MADRENFWRLEHLSDRQLLERLQGVLRTQRCALAELIAHLGEVEERRLHLAAAHGSLFSYCVQHLGMSEDEACRRIELARLARRFPLLFGELASGRISLSVALLLKPVLTPDNHAELIGCVRRSSLRMARELLAARFPSPDVPSRIRKLPERRVAHAMPAAEVAHTMPAAHVAHAMPAADVRVAHAMPAADAHVAHAMPAADAHVAHAMPAADVAHTIPVAVAHVTADVARAMFEAVAVAHAMPAADVAHTIPVAVAHVTADVARAMFEAVAVAHAMPAAAADAARATLAAVVDVVPARVAAPGITTEATTTPVRASAPRPPLAPELEHALLAGVGTQSLSQDPLAPTEPSPAPAQPCLLQCSDPRRRNELRQRIEPLSAQRYRVQFTADASLKQKLELARDLLRHSNPNGDFAPIVSRALDLLLQQLLQRRFGARRKDTPHRSTRPASHAAEEAAPTAEAAPPPPIATAQSSTLPLAVAAPACPVAPDTAPSALKLQSSTQSVAVPAPARILAGPSVSASLVAAACATARLAPTSRVTNATSHIARAARRAVLERDGLACCWVDETGKHCGSSAWLEFDHQHPSGKGGSSEPDNLRLLCRAHNRFAAERAYGRDHVERAIQARQRSSKRRGEGGQPPSSSPAPA